MLYDEQARTIFGTIAVKNLSPHTNLLRGSKLPVEKIQASSPYDLNSVKGPAFSAHSFKLITDYKMCPSPLL